jgi:hypothetical protein
MEWQLHKTAIACVFGQAGSRPLRRALLRLAVIFLCSVLLGGLLAYSLASLPSLPKSAPVTSALLLTIGTQACVLLVLVSAGALQRTATFERLLLLWPLSPDVRWRVYILPGAILGVFALALVAPSLAMATWRAGLSPIFIPLYCSLGLIAAVACFYGVHHLRTSRLMVISLIVAIEYWLARQSADSPIAASLGFGAIMIILCFLFRRGATHLAGSLAESALHESKTVGAKALPRQWWLLKTALRSRAFRISLLTNVALSAGLCLLLNNMVGGTMAAPFAASLLAATFTSDIRSLARRYRPSEITAVRGTLCFLRQELVVAGILGAAIALPLLAVSGPTLVHLFQFAASVSTGLFAGSLVAPAQRDITSQGLATLCCMAVLTLPAQFAGTANPSNVQSIFLFSAVTAVTCLASYFIEYKRNPFYWRSHAS